MPMNDIDGRKGVGGWLLLSFMAMADCIFTISKG